MGRDKHSWSIYRTKGIFGIFIIFRFLYAVFSMQKKEIKQTNVQMQQGRTRQTESTTKTQMCLAGEGGATICVSISGTDRCTQTMNKT